jgi:hypothetical protein
MSHRGNRGAAIALASALAAAAALGQHDAGEDPLAGLEITDETIGWAGIELGMSLVQAERRFGLPLPLTERPGARCGRFAAAAERDGLILQVGFPTARPGAKVEEIFVRFEGYQVGANAAALAASLKRRVPDAAYMADHDRPDLQEADDPGPAYRFTRGKNAFAVHLRPRDGVQLARAECLE